MAEEKGKMAKLAVFPEPDGQQAGERRRLQRLENT